MLSSLIIKERLSAHREELLERFHVTSLALFGSYARGDANESSDVDLLVEFTDVPDLLAYIETEEYLKEILETEVDLVHKRTVHPALQKAIYAEALQI